MGRCYFKQPNGKFGIWSSVVDSPILINATKEEIVEFQVNTFREELKENFDLLLNNPDSYAAKTTLLDFHEIEYRMGRQVSFERYSKEYADNIIKKISDPNGKYEVV